jgi:hypothetical protein
VTAWYGEAYGDMGKHPALLGDFNRSLTIVGENYARDDHFNNKREVG